MKDRKRQVTRTAQKLFVEKGVTNTSVQDIIDKSQISKGTFYNYFSSKNECLIAILENIHDETLLKRREILVGQNIANKDILAKQISIRIMINREHNLIPIFQAVHHSGDLDLKAAVKRYQLAEFAWLTERLIDVYGDESISIAPDCAVIMHGIIQHMMHIGRNWSKRKITPTELIDFTIRRMDAVVANMIKTKDNFFEEDIFLGENVNKKVYTKSEILAQMDEFNRTVSETPTSDSNQLIQFIIEEINAEIPRVAIMESVNRSFREAFTGTNEENQAEELATNIWGYIDTLKK